ncbi:xanthine dehydrogenase molybdenum binding subunit apoprotein [Saccharopolyspora erythraea NRRL 2338]|uniref:Carbon-monoxide dehydrogenase n=2 Tax=Saccharopolyspora erythraea TaxID=1836 RepID=A4FGW3_SACEN|nr:xanthine dehydrogenase family protein molybdopterin-binding subunit [Saccharopolyspora erythraea]EQD81745.1 xanthine dehydrogenase [Saccharopolyspora erythraea D]PFG96992.1 xanthine dehydrogenase molybdenum binding subunit apoprotein [Saccharopolyspora erythraea NRRL 2338]QRK87206.1 xanthine dehydrogenase family protein [Saccharopolyspora erythraea]CAM03288.1 carbon-monoxide dehydrogenase [Saccharopolyspora erythraea NRRL 2338]
MSTTSAPTAGTAVGHRVIGTSVRRHEDDRLLRGLGRFADDVDRIGQAHARVVRSGSAHAEILGVDTAQARSVPGVLTVITGAELAGIPPIPIRLPRGDEPAESLQPVLAVDRVRYVGEPVAVVVAEDPYTAEDAAELVVVDLRELPAAVEAAGTKPVATLEAGYGDVAGAFAAAEHVVELELEVGRHAAVPLETRGLVAEYDVAARTLQVWGATKVPVFNRGVLARMLGMPQERIRLHAMDTGGGFGARGEFYPEDLLIPWLARHLRRPVKWTEDRAESLVALNHSRQQRHRVAAAFDADARLLALRDEIVHDNGAYLRTHGLLVPELTIGMLPGPYRVPAYHAAVDVVLTNKTPCGTYRAPGRYEGTFAREHLLDVAADRIGIDRAELRRRNLLRADEMPHVRPLRALGTDVVLDAGDYPGLLRTALERTLPWRAEAERLRAEGRTAGFGFAMFLEKSGLGPHETADVLVEPSGLVRVHSGGTSLGQGIETALAQIAADRLGVDYTSVRVVNGDTELQPFGLGSWASRSTVLAGNAVDLAAQAVVERARQVAALMLDVPRAWVEQDGAGFAADGRRVELAEVAAACAPGSRYLEAGVAPGLQARRVFEVDHMTYPYGVHVALVEIDRGTGHVSVLRYLVAYEVGRAINPALVEGQLLGGVAQGLGGAVYENFHYDEQGQPQATTFMDYLLPTAAEVPGVVEALVTEDAPSPDNPLGVKGAGEGGITAVGAAVANAVRDAIGLSGDVGHLPLAPRRVAELAN